MMHAAKAGHFLALKTLHDHGCRVFDRDPDGWTSLIYAADAGHWPVVEYLLGNNADATVTTRFQETALMKAAMNGHSLVCKLMMKYSEVDVNSTNRDGNSAIMLAAYYGRKQTVRTLATFADTRVDIVNSAGQTARNILPSTYAVNTWEGPPLPNEIQYARLAISHSINDSINEGTGERMKKVILQPLRGELCAF